MSYSELTEGANYELLIPPLELEFPNMTRKQAKDNFDWFIKKIPERIEYLKNRCAEYLKIPLYKLEGEPESLINIWKWFIEIAHIEDIPEDELNQSRKSFAHLGESFIAKKRFSVVTEYIIRDIGMYIGNMYTSKYQNIYWGFYSSPKNDFFVNRPLLMGFIDNAYNPPFKAIFEPIHMTGIQAMRIFKNSANEDDLYNLFIKWTSLIPNE